MLLDCPAQVFTQIQSRKQSRKLGRYKMDTIFRIQVRGSVQISVSSFVMHHLIPYLLTLIKMYTYIHLYVLNDISG